MDLAVKGISKEMAKRGAADVFKWWMFMATDVIGELSFGESFKMLESGKVSAGPLGDNCKDPLSCETCTE